MRLIIRLTHVSQFLTQTFLSFIAKLNPLKIGPIKYFKQKKIKIDNNQRILIRFKSLYSRVFF